MRTRFGELLRGHMKACGLGLRPLAERAGTNRGVLDNAIHGRNCPPLEDVPKWADALGLEGQARVDFLLEAQLANCPPEIQQLARELLEVRDQLLTQVGPLTEAAQQAQAWREELEQLRAENDRLRAENARLRRP